MKSLIFIMMALYSSTVFSAIQIDSSRVIYTEGQKSAVLKINNTADKSYIVQTWIDADPALGKKVMVVTPPVLKLIPEQAAALRFIYAGQGLPADRESVLWINVQEIPPRATEPYVMQLAVRTRLKLFYRPLALRTTLNEQVEKLKMDYLSDGLMVHNNGPMNISLSQLTVRTPQGKTSEISAPMISPFSKVLIHYPTGARVTGLTYINDYGGVAKINLR